MKPNIILFSCILCISTSLFSQADGSFFTIQLGQKKCLFKYSERVDSTYVETDSAHSKTIVTQINPVTLAEKVKWVKDTVLSLRSLTLEDNNSKSIHLRTPLGIDTVTEINPVTLKENTKIIAYTDAQYHIETEMTYFDFLLLLKTRFELRNPQKNLKVYSFNIYYESADSSEMIRVEYPETTEGVIAKLNCLTKGGFILLSLRQADHGLINIDAQSRFLALIHIKN